MTQRDTEEKLCAAAVKMVVAHGYKGATTRRIAAEAGVTEVTLFRKFGTKEQLIKASILRHSETLPIPPSDPYTGDLRADLTQVVEIYSTLVRQRGSFMFAMLSELSNNPHLREVLELPFQKTHSILHLLGRYQSEGKLRGTNAIHTFLALLGPILMSHALCPLMETSLQQWDTATHIETFLEGHGVANSTST